MANSLLQRSRANNRPASNIAYLSTAAETVELVLENYDVMMAPWVIPVMIISHGWSGAGDYNIHSHERWYKQHLLHFNSPDCARLDRTRGSGQAVSFAEFLILPFACQLAK